MLVLKKERNFISSVKYNLKGSDATNKNDTVITVGFFSFGIKILLFTGVSPGLTVHDQEQTPALCIKKNLIFFSQHPIIFWTETWRFVFPILANRALDLQGHRYKDVTMRGSSAYLFVKAGSHVAKNGPELAVNPDPPASAS